jgi:ferredoxin-NADP reductase
LKNGSSCYISESNIYYERKVKIAKDIYEYKFRLSQEKDLKLTKYLPGIHWIGRHFSVSSKKLNKTRYYSICLSLNTFYQEKLLLLIADSKQNEMNDLKISKDEIFSDSFSIYSKHYPTKEALSHHLNTLTERSESDLIIKGPLGLGLNLSILEGTYVIFAAGTGIIPFLDYISFTLRYMVYQVNKIRNPNNNNLLFPEEEDIFQNQVNSNFKVLLFYSVTEYNSALFLNVLENLSEYDKNNNLNIFNIELRVSSENKVRWDDDFMRKKLINHADINKVFIVGPIGFMDDIKSALQNSGLVKKSQIVLV